MPKKNIDLNTINTLNKDEQTIFGIVFLSNRGMTPQDVENSYITLTSNLFFRNYIKKEMDTELKTCKGLSELKKKRITQLRKHKQIVIGYDTIKAILTNLEKYGLLESRLPINKQEVKRYFVNVGLKDKLIERITPTFYSKTSIEFNINYGNPNLNYIPETQFEDNFQAIFYFNLYDKKNKV